MFIVKISFEWNFACPFLKVRRKKTFDESNSFNTKFNLFHLWHFVTMRPRSLQKTITKQDNFYWIVRAKSRNSRNTIANPRASVDDCRQWSRPVGGFWRCSGQITLVFQLSAKNKRGRSIMGWQSRRPSGFIAVPSVLWRFHGNLNCVSRPVAWSSSSLSSLLWSSSSTFNPWIPLSVSLFLYVSLHVCASIVSLGSTPGTRRTP